MKNQLFILILAMFCCMFNLVAIAQTQDKTLLDKTLPEHVITPVINYRENYIDLKKTKGTPIIIDFWASWCVPCVKEFPRLDSLQSKFKGKVLIIPVAWDNQQKAFTIANRMIVNNQIKMLPIGYDSTLVRKINGGELVSVWIDKNGVIKYFTNSIRITEDNLKNFIAGKDIPEFQALIDNRNKRMQEKLSVFDVTKPMLVNGNGGSDSSYIYRSILTPYLKEAGQVPISQWLSPNRYTERIQIVNTHLQYLYEIAYRPPICPNPIMSDYNVYGNFYRYAIVEVKDPRPFMHSYVNEVDSLSRGRYSYELDFGNSAVNRFNLDSASRYANKFSDSTSFKIFGAPNNKILTMQCIMRQDLKNHFGYNVTIEERELPCTYIRKTSNNINGPITKKGTPKIEATPLSLTLVNQPLSELIKRLWFARQLTGRFEIQFGAHDYSDNVIIDNTGITQNVDITVDCDLNNINSVNSELKKYGLELVPGKKMMATIVIHD